MNLFSRGSDWVIVAFGLFIPYISGETDFAAERGSKGDCRFYKTSFYRGLLTTNLPSKFVYKWSCTNFQSCCSNFG